MIRGVGVDSIEICRVAKALANPRFLARVFTDGERAYILAKGATMPQSAAGIFAAKEAAAKALGTGFGAIRLTDVEVTHDANGAPGLCLRGAAAALAGACLAHISITHDRARAVAFCVIEQIAGKGDT